MKNKITKEKVENYYAITSKALDIAKRSVSKVKQKEADENFAKLTKFSKKKFETLKFTVFRSCKFQNVNNSNFSDEILSMVNCYLKDSLYFKDKKDYVNAFACLNYAHGWLDCGARLKIFKVKDSKLFTV